MTPEKQRIKIAEAHGWVLNPECDFLGKAFPQCWTHDDYNMVFHDYELPNYTDDLNAMHEAEKILSDKQCQTMNDLLWDMMNGRKFLWQATAAQRAEAFLKTLNLWES